MMKIRNTALLLTAFTLIGTLPANAVEQKGAIEETKSQTIKREDKGFSFELAGNAEEEGALKLFIKDTSSKHEIHDINADDLNRIAPAAGIKFQFEF